MGDGWNEQTGQTDHAQAMRWARHLDPSAAEFARFDARAAIAANPTGRKAGHYADVAHYCDMRLAGKL